MAYYGGDPLGLNWMPMLALYSSLGNKSNTHEQNCQIGTQLQKLDGKDRIVIEGISSKIDQLIQRNNVSVGRDDMEALKDSIVKELGTIASKYGNQSSGPVVCDANSLVFDEDVKSLLSELVREKASGYTGAQTRNGGDVEDDSPYSFDPSLYNKRMSELLFMFKLSDKRLIIMTEDFYEECGINSMYADNQGRYNTTRSISETQILTILQERVMPELYDSHKEFVLKNFPRKKARGVYILNDVELLRGIHTYLVEHETVLL